MAKQFNTVEVKIYPHSIYLDDIGVTAETLFDLLGTKRKYDALGRKYVCKFICGFCTAQRVKEVKQAFNL